MNSLEIMRPGRPVNARVTRVESARAERSTTLCTGAVPASPLTQQLVDEEVRRIVEGAEEDVIKLLERERGRLDALARALLERETLDQPEAYEVAGVELSETLPVEPT